LATGALILIVAVVEASYHMAYQDSLTGLPARRALNEALLRLGGHYTVAMLDVDHFKRINDHHGHDVGDQVLKMIAAKLAQLTGGCIERRRAAGTRYRPDTGLGRRLAQPLEMRLLDQVLEMRLLDQVIEGEDGALIEKRGGQAERGRGRDRQAVDG